GSRRHRRLSETHLHRRHRVLATLQDTVSSHSPRLVRRKGSSRVFATSWALHTITLFSTYTRWSVVTWSGADGSWRRPAETVGRYRRQDSGKPHGGCGHDGPDLHDGFYESRRTCEHC